MIIMSNCMQFMVLYEPPPPTVHNAMIHFVMKIIMTITFDTYWYCHYWSSWKNTSKWWRNICWQARNEPQNIFNGCDTLWISFEYAFDSGIFACQKLLVERKRSREKRERSNWSLLLRNAGAIFVRNYFSVHFFITTNQLNCTSKLLCCRMQRRQTGIHKMHLDYSKIAAAGLFFLVYVCALKCKADC